MWVEETKNGKYKAVERYTDYLTGKKKKVSVTMKKNTAQSRKVAQKALDEKIGQAYHKKASKDYTLRELVDAYRKGQKGEVKESTYSRNYHVCNTLMKILGEDTLINRMSATYIKDKLKATGKSAGSLNEKITRFKALIRWGFRSELLTKDDIVFLDKIEPFPDISRREKIQDKFLESEELKSLLSVMQVDIWRGVTEFLALTGLRIGELIALPDASVNLKERNIHTEDTYDSNNRLTTTTKTFASTRDIYIQDELVGLVKKLKHMMLLQKIQYGYEASELFLVDKVGNNLSYDAYRKYLKESGVKAIGREITPHVLRHTHTSLLAENGVPLDVISRRLGHEDSKVTRDVYFHVTKRLKEKDNQQIASIKIM